MRTLTLFLAVAIPFFAEAQDDFLTNVQVFQAQLNEDYRNPRKSPLEQEDLLRFKELPFFPINDKYRIEAKFVRTPNERAFEMPTSTDRKVIYEKYGVASFKLNDGYYSLSLYQKKDRSNNHLLFLPFMDLTNGIETYGGGRYLELAIPKSDTIVIDFNKAFNPYCAYNQRFSCPIPPSENLLNCMIHAGMMIQDDWEVLKLEELGFAIRFPATPQYIEDTTSASMIAGTKRLRYIGDFSVDSNFVFQVMVKTYLESTCPQSSPNDYNDCFKDILAEKLELTGGALMYLHHGSMRGHDSFEFELLAQGKAYSRFKVVLVENRAYVVSVVTMVQTKDNESINKFFDSFRMLE